jgi:phenylalanyl-tRNA synthetase beta chain
MMNGRRIGSLGQLAPSIAEYHGVPAGDQVYVAELDLDVAMAAAGGDISVEPLPRHPSVTRDISVLVEDTLPAATVRKTIVDAGPETLVRVREFDRYQGKGIPDGKVSLSVRLTFRAPDRTLTDAEVQTAMESVVAALKDRHGAIQR